MDITTVTESDAASWMFLSEPPRFEETSRQTLGDFGN